jgi:hypothetical protein
VDALNVLQGTALVAMNTQANYSAHLRDLAERLQLERGLWRLYGEARECHNA